MTAVAYLDESGDESGRLDRGASPLFIVALVVFPDADEAERWSDRIDELRRELGLPARYEYHFSRNAHVVRLAFLAAVAAFDFTYHAVSIEKRETAEAHLSLYSDACAHVCRLAGDVLDRVLLTIDMREQDKRTRERVAADVRRHVNQALGTRALARVRPRKSGSDNLVQLADYAAGVRRFIVDGKRNAELYHRLIARRAGLFAHLYA